MYKVIDDFLPISDFNLFSEITLRASTLNYGRTKNHPAHWYNSILKSQYNDIEKEVSRRFDPLLWDIAKRIENKIKEEVDYLHPLTGLSYLFSNFSYRVGPHFDNPYEKQKIYNPLYCADSYSAFLYGHKEWDAQWGGMLGFHKRIILDSNKFNNFDKDNYFGIESKPNRLVYYSLNEVHSVTPIVAQEVVRKTLKISFKTDKIIEEPKSLTLA